MQPNEENGLGASFSGQKSLGSNATYLIPERDPTKKSVMLTERRKVRRKPLASPIDIFCRYKKYRFGKGFATDLSEQGMKLIVPECFEIGKELSLHFSLGNGWKLDFIGRIVHAEEAVESIAYGIEFLPGQGTFLLRLWLGHPYMSRSSIPPESGSGGEGVRFFLE